MKQNSRCFAAEKAHIDDVSTMGPQRLLLISIHDVCPRFENEVNVLVDRIAPYVGHRFAMLVVPNHWRESPILPRSDFAARLRAWSDMGVEMFVHGYFHQQDRRPATLTDRLRAQLMTAREGEFLGVDCNEACRRLARGQQLLEDIIGRPVTGFVAPAWLYGDGALTALRARRVRIAEDHWEVWSPALDEVLARGPVITWASRSSLRLLSSLVAASVLRHLRLPVLRVGVHPPDVHQPALMKSIEATLSHALKRRRPGAYSELLRAPLAGSG